MGKKDSKKFGKNTNGTDYGRGGKGKERIISGLDKGDDTLPSTKKWSNNNDNEDEYANDEDDEADFEGEVLNIEREPLEAKICMWEFGQNDPNRDSGTKLRRLGYATQLRIGSSFPGIVLSSEATIHVSASDKELVEKHGIAGINCSWNRLDEIPFGQMGKGRNQRILPLLFAANSVNYGRPFKMNTAEAFAACLYISGFKNDAITVMSNFSYGDEFLRLNKDELDSYSECSNGDEVKALHLQFIARAELKQKEKEDKKELERLGFGKGYMDDMDLPPLVTDEYEEYEQEDNFINDLNSDELPI